MYQNEYSGVQLHTFHSWDCRYLCVLLQCMSLCIWIFTDPCILASCFICSIAEIQELASGNFHLGFCLSYFSPFTNSTMFTTNFTDTDCLGLMLCTACAVRHHTSQSQRGSQLLCCWYNSLLIGLGQLGKMSKSCGLCNLHRKPHATPILFQLWPMIVTSIWGTNQWMALLSLSLLLYFCLLSQRNKPLKKMACSKPCACSYLHLWLRQHMSTDY